MKVRRSVKSSQRRHKSSQRRHKSSQRRRARTRRTSRVRRKHLKNRTKGRRTRRSHHSVGGAKGTGNSPFDAVMHNKDTANNMFERMECKSRLMWCQSNKRNNEICNSEPTLSEYIEPCRRLNRNRINRRRAIEVSKKIIERRRREEEHREKEARERQEHREKEARERQESAGAPPPSTTNFE
jgi:hypothetical protein